MLNLRLKSILPSFLLATLAGVPAFSLESLGTFHFQEFLLSPSLELREPSQGGFDLKESWMSVQWNKDENVQGEMRLGTLDGYQAPIWMVPSVATGLGILEAWVEGRSKWGNIRVGRIPITDGFEGSFSEGFWLMPASQVKKNHWVFQRDEGLTLWAETKPWLTQITVHNGEAGPNADNKMWVTGRWQYFSNADGDGFLVTASEGSTTPLSTTGSLAASRDQFHFDPTQNAKIRYATASFFHLWKRNYWNLEGGRGDILQFEDKFPFAWGRLDLSWNLGGDLNLLLRYEQLQSDLKNPDTIQKNSGIGFLLSSQDQLSSLTVFGTHKQESPSINNDEILIMFRLNSTSLGQN